MPRLGFCALGRLNNDNKKSVVFSASSDPTKFKVYVEKRIPSNKRSHETTLTLDVGNTTGFHSIVAVHYAPPSGNKGMLQIYWDGVLKATYTMTTDIPFGDLMQFCASPSYLVSPCVSSTENPDVAFHDVRFFSRAFTAADAAAYAAKYPAGTLRQCAYVQSASTNAVDTGYCTNPGTRYTADFQYLTNTKRRGLKVKPRTIEIPVEGSEPPVTKSGLVLVNAGAFTLYVR